jgi:LacI family repressor for deo operon, udp, cdd, tsx, nupC, and nupG
VAVTLRDVARHAGVSPRTVSNVVHDYPHVSTKMRARVQASLDALNYTPNLVARSLRQGRTGVLTLLVPDLVVPYFGELAHEVVEQASGRGYTVMIDETGGVAARERALLDTAAESGWVDGVLMSSIGLSGRALAGIGASMPVVLLGERTARSALDHVGIDNVSAAYDAVTHLVAGGRTRIAALGGTESPLDATSRLRLRGYRKALRAAGLSGEGLHSRTPDYKRRSAAPAVRTLLDRSDPPDAIFCFSDELAAGALRELHDQGVRVPEEMAVAGFDDADGSRFLTPSLTSIRPDRVEIARAALEILLHRIDGGGGAPRDVRVPHELMVRESSSHLPRGV